MCNNDDILLDFTSEQYEKYLSILSESRNGPVKIEILPRVEIPDPIPSDGVKDILSLLSSEAVRLLPKGSPKDRFFSFSQPTQKEKEEYMALCFEVINALCRISSRLRELFCKLNKKRSIIEEAYIRNTARYRAYLPYRGALGDMEQYKSELRDLDSLLSSDINLNMRILKDAERTLDVIVSVCDSIIPSFISSIGANSGNPPYPDFAKNKIMDATRSFCEQLRLQGNRL